MNVEVNWVGVLLAAVSSMAVGAVWYAKPVFGSRWQKLVKLSDDRMNQDAPKALASAFILSLVTAYVLAHVAFLSNNFFGNSFTQDAVTTAFWLWLGLTAARFLTHDTFERRPLQLSLLSIGNELVTLLVMGLVIGLAGH